MTRPLVRLTKTALVLGATLAMAQAQTPSQRLMPCFQNTDINEVARGVGEATGVDFLVDPRVRAQVTFCRRTPMTARQLNEAFQAILSLYNAVAVPSGNGIVKIVPDASVRTMGAVGTTGVGPETVVDEVIEAKNISAQQLNAVLRPLVSQAGTMAPVAGTNSLLITDRAANVARIRALVAKVDQSSNTDLDLFRLEFASASDVSKVLTTLMQGQPADAAAGIAPRVGVDERTNSVLVSGDPTQRLRIGAWIAQLDTPVENGGGTQVRRLRYASAEDLAAKLKEMATGIAAVTPGAAGTPSAPAASAATAADRSVSIIAHPETNALIITAPPKMMTQLMTIVDELDIPRTQVLIEAVIADVSTNKSADLGVNWVMFSNEDGTSTPAAGFISPVGGANSNPISIVDLIGAIQDPASATAVPLGGTIGVGRINSNGLNFAAMIRALRADADSNVIANPQLTALDNQEATFESALEVPVLTGSYTNAGGGSNGSVNPFTTVNRQKVGTTLKFTPQINGGNVITLTIELESSALTGATGDGGSVITDTRNFKTTVLVEDGATIVVGGMIRDGKTAGETRIPFLGRIPLLGGLFKTRSGKREQSNLMVFIRPRILGDAEQAAAITNERYDSVRNAQKKQSEGKVELVPLLPGDTPPLLPPANAAAGGAPNP